MQKQKVKSTFEKENNVKRLLSSYSLEIQQFNKIMWSKFQRFRRVLPE